MFGDEEAAGRQGAVEHSEHFDPLRWLKVKQHVLTQDQRVSLKRLLEREKVMPLKRNPTPDVFDHAKRFRFGIRFEIFIQDAFGQSRQFFPRIDRGLDHRGELAFDIGGIDAEIAEREAVHAIGEDHAKGVRLLARGRTGVPDAGMAASREAGKGVFHGAFEYLLVSVEKSKSQFQAALPTARSTVRSASRTSSRRSFSL